MIDWFLSLPSDLQITLITLIVTTIGGGIAYRRKGSKGGSHPNATSNPDYRGFTVVDAERLSNLAKDVDAMKVDIAVIRSLLNNNRQSLHNRANSTKGDRDEDHQ